MPSTDAWPPESIAGSLLRGIYESAPDAVLIVDEDGRILMANGMAETLTGYARDGLIGEPVEMLVPARLHGVHRHHRGEFVSSPRIRAMSPDLDLTLVRADGGEVTVDISLAPLTVGSRSLVMAVARDITERRRAEVERAELIARIERTRQREHIAGDLHDDVIQSVYAVGLGLHTALVDDDVSKEQALSRAISELTGVIADLRAYMDHLRSRDGDEEDEHDVFAVRVQSLLTSYAAREPEWETKIAPEIRLPDELARELFLVTKELISNVARHSGATRASIVLRVTGRVVELRVEDDGVGFSESEIGGGSFGISNLRSRVIGLRGQLDIHSRRGRGTTVTVRVPLPVGVFQDAETR